MIVGTVIMIVAAVVTGILFRVISKTMESIQPEETVVYDKHYAFIAEDSESDLWAQVLAASSDQAREYGAYLEDLGTVLGRDYSAEDLLRIAVNSKVDGIIYSGGSSDKVAGLIDKAVDLYNDLRDKVVKSAGAEKAKVCFTSIRKELLEKTDALYDELSDAVKKGLGK